MACRLLDLGLLVSGTVRREISVSEPPRFGDSAIAAPGQEHALLP